MSALTDVKILERNGEPAFAILPWDMYEKILPMLEDRPVIAHGGIPQAVMNLSFKKEIALITAWREHLGLSQSEVAVKAGMKQPALSRIEKGESKPQIATIKRIADAMGLTVEQLCM